MIYPDSFEHKTGFAAIRNHLAQLCSSALGRTHCEQMSFSTSFPEVKRHLDSTAEMVGIISSDSDFALGGIHDKRQLLASLRVEGSFPAENELPGLRASLASMADIASFFAKARTVDEESGRISTLYPALDTLARDLFAFPAVAAAIDRIVDRHGEIKDNASPELAEIRRSMSACAGSINSTMRRVISNAVKEGYLDPDIAPSVRDGRLVIPVAPMYKRKINGIVHDESASGKTFFIEPAEVVEANNRLRELSIEERREIVRILTALADTIRPEIDALLDGFDLLGRFDFIHAKARYALIIGGALPHLSDKPELEWYHACHPGLKLSLERQGKEIIPLDITLSEKNRILVISGPNAGGKSVTLKTVAIVQYMTQCGILPPVYDNSHMGIMQNIFIDIGDDQSIEDDLSTYSSHLRNMKSFLSGGNERTLILIDEFGGGTEPQIGGAIAQAVLKQFNCKKMWGVITTHYHNLKQFAEETPGLINGSMLYDRQRMEPQFRLAIGNPGSSFAIEIARKTGLPASIIDDASEIVGSDYINLDRYLLDIARDRRYWENKRQAIRQKEKQIEDIIARYESEMEALRSKRREIISEARDQAREILEGSNATIERTIREIRTAQADKERTREARSRLASERETLKAKADKAEAHPMLDKKLKSKQQKAQKTPKPTEERPLQAGDNVVLDGAGTVGTISEISGKNAIVIFGQMKTTVKLNRLKRTLKKAPTGASATPSYISSQTADSSRIVVVPHGFYRIEIAAYILSQSTRSGAVEYAYPAAVELYGVVDIVHHRLHGLVGPHAAHVYLVAESKLPFARAVGGLRGYV